MAYSFKGAIAFGLVYIPITLSVCIKDNDIGFNMIDRNTMSRIKYKKTCTDCNDREVKNEDIVKAYQYQKDRYVIFEDEDFEKIKSEKDKNIVIDCFVNAKEVDPIYFDKSYFVQPNGAEKAFNLLFQAMRAKGKAGIAKTVLGTKETLIMLRVQNGAMVLSTLFFHEEVQSSPAYSTQRVEKKELELAETLIEQMSEEFKPEKYKDEYNEKVKKAIERKIAGREIVETKADAQPLRVINIMEALKQSLKPERKSRAK